LDNANAWYATPSVGRVITVCFVLFLLPLAKQVHLSLARVMLLMRNRSSHLRSRQSISLMCWYHDIFCCLWCSLGSYMIVLLSVRRDMGLGASGELLFGMGLLDMESMANTFFTMVTTGKANCLLQDLSFTLIIIHPSLSSYLSSFSPAHHQSLPKSSFSS
jgi:hypothetical protein